MIHLQVTARSSTHQTLMSWCPRPMHFAISFEWYRAFLTIAGVWKGGTIPVIMLCYLLFFLIHRDIGDCFFVAVLPRRDLGSCSSIFIFASFLLFYLIFMRLCKDWPEDNHAFYFQKIRPFLSRPPTLIDRSSIMDISLSVWWLVYCITGAFHFIMHVS